MRHLASYVRLGAVLLATTGAWLAGLPARAGEIPVQAAKILPCDGVCQAMQWGRLQLGSATVPTSLHDVDQVFVNQAGDFIVLGRTANGLPTVAIVAPGANEARAEFWAASRGVSPDARFVVFTPMIATHGAGAEYSNKFVYAYDTMKAPLSSEGFTRIPRDATPVFPPLLAKDGYRAAINLSPDRLYSVVSTNFKFDGLTAFEFVASPPGKPGSAALYVPIRIAAGLGDAWNAARITYGETRSACNATVLDVESLLASCR